ncbi:unnamed protein product [Dicrocoelium dendriticum]|nr:unnamed protein product [Dicrocoelium dendriticum]
MPAKVVEHQNTVFPELRLGKLLKQPRRSCIFPIQIRQETASYVPYRTLANGKPFEFTVMFKISSLQQNKSEPLDDADICPRLINLSNSIITNCTNIIPKNQYVIAFVQIGPTEGSVYEAQLQLMFQLNTRTPNSCSFNVVPKTISKGY